MKCKKIDTQAKIPTRKHATDAGLDVYTLHDVTILPHSNKVIRTGITIEFPENTVAFVWPKSKANFLVGAGVIDNDYQGEILVKIFNTSNEPLEIKKHQGIAQIVITPLLYPSIEEVNEIHQKETKRGGTGGIVNN